MSGDNGRLRGANSAYDTINAAASVIASADNYLPQAPVQKRRWGSFWRLYWCFGSQKHRQRIGHAVLVPEAAASSSEAPAVENVTQTSLVVLPFVAPPSSPASFIQSEPPSVTQSPVGLLSLTSISASMYSPGGPASIFAIGPYAHETQLVSPPVFSTFTTEPSTAPFTPPPESVHLTTPSSPEVPFAHLLDPNYQNVEPGQRFQISHYEFQSYQLHPGSPVGQLISPRSVISGSGSSSPFPDPDFLPHFPNFLEFQTGDQPKLWNLDKLSAHRWGSRQGSGSLTPNAVAPRSNDNYLLEHPTVGSLTPDSTTARSRDNLMLDRQDSGIGPLANSFKRPENEEAMVNHRVSFEVTSEDVVRCVEKKPASLPKAASASLKNADSSAEINKISGNIVNGHKGDAGETSDGTPEKVCIDGEIRQRHQKHRSITLGSLKEFNFDDSVGANDDKPDTTTSNWWANENLVDEESETSKDWSFFPMMQPGVS